MGGRAPGGHWAGLILQAPVRRAARILGSGAEGGGQWRYFAPAVRGRGSRLVESAASGGCCSSRVDLEGRLVSWRELKMNKKKRWKRLSIPGIWKRLRRWTWAVRKSFDRLRFDGPGSLPLRQHLISKGLGLIACCSSPSNSPVPEKISSLDWPNCETNPVSRAGAYLRRFALGRGDGKRSLSQPLPRCQLLVRAASDAAAGPVKWFGAALAFEFSNFMPLPGANVHAWLMERRLQFSSTLIHEQV